jgi:hypothetical protein
MAICKTCVNSLHYQSKLCCDLTGKACSGYPWDGDCVNHKVIKVNIKLS